MAIEVNRRYLIVIAVYDIRLSFRAESRNFLKT
jgi:hypothetical protein